MSIPDEPQADFVREPLPWGGVRVRLDRLTDGRIMCCVCFEYRTRDQLQPHTDEPGKVWDVCRTCWPQTRSPREDHMNIEITFTPDDGPVQTLYATMPQDKLDRFQKVINGSDAASSILTIEYSHHMGGPTSTGIFRASRTKLRKL